MRVFLMVIWVLTIVISIATGLFKILQQEADIQLFGAIGFNETMVTLLGIVQFIGGVLLVPSKTRVVGAYIMIPTFIVASLAVFANGMWVFGGVSLVFIAMAYLVIIRERRKD